MLKISFVIFLGKCTLVIINLTFQLNIDNRLWGSIQTSVSALFVSQCKKRPIYLPRFNPLS